MSKFYLLLFALIITFSNLYGQQRLGNNSTYNILFIGNSLTYTNDLPKLVKDYAQLKGIDIATTMVAFPNYAIEDHWNNNQVQKLIAGKKYDFVILQQGPSSQNNGRNMLIDYGKKYSRLCALHNAKLCFFMVWPSLQYYHTFNGVIKNYTDAASINNAILLPVGERWKTDIGTSKNHHYYSSDGFHPSLKGSQVSAKVIVDQLFQL